MRPLRLLLSLACSLLAVTLLLYVAFGSNDEQEIQGPITPAKKSRFKALFSFTSPVSLFPPSAIISLTDDNSTFFLARPAAFGPLLPSAGLSSALWIGSGFGDDAMGRGELGCSDVPGWSEGNSADVGSDAIVDAVKKEKGVSPVGKDRAQTKHAENGLGKSASKEAEDDGTDDYLHMPVPNKSPKKQNLKTEHADIESLQEAAEIHGKVVLLKRGGCGFLEKAKWAQRRGGVALIVGDDVRGGALIRMYAHGDTSNVTIPSLFTSHTTAHLLSSLLPSGGTFHNLSPEDAAKLELIKGTKGGANGKSKDKGAKKQNSGSRPSSTLKLKAPTATPKAQRRPQIPSTPELRPDNSESGGWFHSIFSFFGFGSSQAGSGRSDSRRPPSSGNIDWVQVEDWEDDQPAQTTSKTQRVVAQTTTPTPAPGLDNFVIGEQDWRDPDLMAPPTSSKGPASQSIPAKGNVGNTKSGSATPNSGEYGKSSVMKGSDHSSEATEEEHKGWFTGWFSGGDQEPPEAAQQSPVPIDSQPVKPDYWHTTPKKDEDVPAEPPQEHEGLWVTLTPTNMSSSPFFDTLLVLVVSPLVTLTVVYAMLLLRSRIRRRRWRAPKSVVERLPVRTYHTISDSTPSPVATPVSATPTTPLLQHTVSQPAISRSRSHTTSDIPAMSSSVHSIQHGGRTPEEEKREAGLAAWRRRYGGRQKECVVCLEEYEDGVSRVMSLPCGHEFHADCITPWLVTRRRTCPICKGDVVRSLSQSYRDRGLRSPSPNRLAGFFDDEADPVQEQAAQTRNDSPSASLPLAIPTGSNPTAPIDADLEANWERDDEEEQTQTRDRTIDLSSSLSHLSSTVTTTIWRGLDAVRGATGLQRRPSREEVDRDR